MASHKLLLAAHRIAFANTHKEIDLVQCSQAVLRPGQKLLKVESHADRVSPTPTTQRAPCDHFDLSFQRDKRRSGVAQVEGQLLLFPLFLVAK